MTGPELAASGVRTANPFEADGVWLRCQLHAHSSESDGDLSPRALTRHYEAAGFDVLAITDHWLVTRVPPTRSLLTVPGAEVSFDLATPGCVGEVLVFGVEDLPSDPGGDRRNWLINYEEHYEQRTFPDLTSAGVFAREQGGTAYVAHPYWSGLDPRVIVEADAIDGMEIFNATGDLECGRGNSAMAWDAALEAGRSLHGIATDDAHLPLFDIGLAWTWLKVAERSEEAVVHALRAGMTYASAGPALREVHRDGATVEVATSPCRSIVLQMEREKGCSVVAGSRGRSFGRILETNDDGLIVRARLESPWPEPRYVRVTATDARGFSAWTNPL